MLSLASKRAVFSATGRAFSSMAELMPVSTRLNMAIKHGDEKALATIMEKDQVDGNYRLYDQKTLLHMAAQEGQMGLCRYLIESRNADVQALDRFGRSPIHVANQSGETRIASYLQQQQGSMSASASASASSSDLRGDLPSVLCSAAGEGDVQGLRSILDAKVDGVTVNEVRNHDMRTALHLAALNGRIKAVEFLLRRGADVYAKDRYGKTALDAANSGSGRTYEACGILLREEMGLRGVNIGAGGESRTATASTSLSSSSFAGPLLRASIQNSLPRLCHMMDARFVESWLPNETGTEFVASDWWLDYTLLDKHAQLGTDNAGAIASNTPDSFMGEAFASQHMVQMDELRAADMGTHDGATRLQLAKEAGFESAVALPIVDDGEVKAILKFYLDRPVGMPAYSAHMDFADFETFCSSIISAGVYGDTKQPSWRSISEKELDRLSLTAEQSVSLRSAVFSQLVKEEVFHPCKVYSEVEKFFDLNMDGYYFATFPVKMISNHIQSYIAAKELAKTYSTPEDLYVFIENNQKLIGQASGNGAGYNIIAMVPNEDHFKEEVEEKLQNRIRSIDASLSYSLQMYTSKRTIVTGGDKRLVMYSLTTQPFVNQTVDPAETSIWELSSRDFLANKSKQARDRYQDIINKSHSRLSPLSRVYEPMSDGSIPAMVVVKNDGTFDNESASNSQYLKQLCKQHGIDSSLQKKFVETFANGMICYSLYFQPGTEEGKIKAMLKQFRTLNTIPSSSITPMFLSGDLNADEYAYASVTLRAILYFLKDEGDELKHLFKVLKEKDSTSQGRFKMLYSKLSAEVASPARLNSIAKRYPSLVKELYKDFERRVTTQQVPTKDTTDVQPLGENSELLAMIDRQAVDELDRQILSAVASLNRHINKTNFYKRDTSAISLRLDPSFMTAGDSGLDYPQVPYGMFFVVGADFQGFHIRFADIARGGLRLIQSRTETDYNKNLVTLFNENYGLAHTQNMKNKDIPEFGSKGTILLHQGKQQSGFYAFQRYCGSLLDLLIPTDDNEGTMVDNYGKEEILFFGPDEGTADWMKWTCDYARKRGYPFWRAISTGKPPSLGGIPHDTYGMTTRSVHRYVVNTLERMGLEEEQMSKIQTGGPDGDLGSNEILLSKDKTVGIVDGSGVLYDDQGLDREELTRLATERLTIDHFSADKLSDGGFRVLVSDRNITLPARTVQGVQIAEEEITNGMQFRNDFHTHPLAQADLFVPCGGRPASVHLGNVDSLLNADGSSRYKAIVEGANLFITQDARDVLHASGCVLYKDASTNKGGVTSSSLEVLAALALSDTEFGRHMAVPGDDTANAPEFYQQYVQEIIARIETDANLEFACIEKEYAKQLKLDSTSNNGMGKSRHVLTDELSAKINALCELMNKEGEASDDAAENRTRVDLFADPVLKRRILNKAVPRSLIELVGLEKIIERVPDNYLKAIFTTYISSRYTYMHGIDSNEFDFYEYMQHHMQGDDDAM